MWSKDKQHLNMKKTMVFVALWALTSGVKAQFNFEPVTQLLNDSIGVIGQAGQNCGFMIVQGDSIIYEKYLGSWDSQTYQPIASGSKILSMALMMRLIDEGYLHPNDTVQNFIPSFGGKPFMTLHQLMSHTSGLPGQSQYISDNSYTLQQAVDSIGLKTPMTAFAPGTAFQYGGVSMHVAGRMAEIATGVSWDSLFRQKIALPLGMIHTDYAGLGATGNFRIAGGVGTTMPDFSKLLIMLLQYGRINNIEVLDSQIVRVMQSDQTGEVPLIGTPYFNDALRQNLRYGYGIWIEEATNGETTQYGSQGAFGFTPWIDRCRNIACVFFVRKSLGLVQPTHTRLRNLVEQIIPLKLQKPVITAVAGQLQSSYSFGNQWYFNGSLMSEETGQFVTPSQNGKYSVKFISEEGCEVFSDDYNYMLLSEAELPLSGDTAVYPNPARTVIYFECENGFRIMSSTGELLIESSQDVNRINISELPAGLYFLQTGNRTVRFVKSW
ncbi:MAG: serine hydrolase [Bacteroidota bacterium]|jgi:CubicO group peptidase (beta-lactamase class C family)|nr:serine hydrolase [Saprospiraceae bacterium]